MGTTLLRARSWLEPIALGVALWGLLFAHAAARRADWDPGEMRLSRRFWEDLTVATVNFQRHTGYLYRGREWDYLGTNVAAKLKQALPEAAQQAELRGWQFWRTVPCRFFANAEPMRLRDSDDPGRAWLTVWGFHLLGGIAPYLPLWLAVLAALPLFVWVSYECCRAGVPWVAAGLLGALALSVYAAELLTLPYSAVGFHLLGLLPVIALAVYGLLNAAPTWRGLFVRWLAGGVFFALCALCRGTSRSFLPALVVAAVVTVLRIVPRGRRPRWAQLGGVALALALLNGPYLVIRPPQRHEAWVGVWEGLGDFDRTKGHAWYDPTARQALRQEGVAIPVPIEPAWNAEMEAAFRRMVWRDVASDPLWYARILAQRLPATVLQLRLWPRLSVDGSSYEKSTHPNQGISNAYYSFTPTADTFGLGGASLELPLPWLWAPLLIVTGVAIAERWRHRACRLVPGAHLAVLGLTALAGGALPVLISTASGPETQAFVLVYFLAAGFALDILRRAFGARAVREESGDN